jgi:hypothetical protein
METKIVHRQCLTKDDLVERFVDNFDGFNFSVVELIITQYTFVYGNGKIEKSISSSINIEGTFDGTLFLNRIWYLHVTVIDFAERRVNAYIDDEHVNDALKEDVYNQLNLEQYA